MAINYDFLNQYPSGNGVNAMYPGYGSGSAPQAPTGAGGPGPTPGTSISDVWNFGLGAYDYYKGRDTAGDVAKNLGKGYTSAQDQLRGNLGPWAQRGNVAANRYMGLADQYPTNQLDLPSYSDSDPGAFDPSQLRDPEYLANTPGYQWRIEQGRKERENAAAARGLNLSTNIVRDLEKDAQGMASQEYEKEYDRARDQYGIDTKRAGIRYSADTGEVAGEYEAGKSDAQQRMRNYLPLMESGYGAASTMGQRGAELEVARGGSTAMREQSQGNQRSTFLGDITSGQDGVKSWADTLGISDLSFGDIGDSFGNMRDWFTDPNTSFAGSWDDFWGGVRDFEIGDFSSLFD